MSIAPLANVHPKTYALFLASELVFQKATLDDLLKAGGEMDAQKRVEYLARLLHSTANLIEHGVASRSKTTVSLAAMQKSRKGSDPSLG
jgi:hypothetical protein